MLGFTRKGKKILFYMKYIKICKIFPCLGRVYFRETFFLDLQWSGLNFLLYGFPCELLPSWHSGSSATQRVTGGYFNSVMMSSLL